MTLLVVQTVLLSKIGTWGAVMSLKAKKSRQNIDNKSRQNIDNSPKFHTLQSKFSACASWKVSLICAYPAYPAHLISAINQS